MDLSRARSDLAAARADLERLQAKLQDAQARVARIATFIEMAEEYGASATSPSRGTRRGPAVSRPARGAGGKARAIVDAATTEIERDGRPIRTPELLERLASRGIEVGGSNPITNLSGYLSRSGAFDSSRANGWSLKNGAAGETPAPNSHEAAPAPGV